MSIGSYTNGMVKKMEENTGKIAQALKEKQMREEKLRYAPAPIKEENRTPLLIEDISETPCCSTVKEVRNYLFGMRDVLDAVPDNDYEQGQLSVINKLLAVTREDT